MAALLEEDLLANQHDAVGRTVTIHVVYDGPDLAFVAQQCGLTVEGVVREHTGTQHQVGFFGFAPGFAYIDGLSPRLHLPRRESPRTDIPAGSVAIAANQSVVYPGSTPGGWHLIGRTTTTLWDLREEPPAKLSAGDKIIFESVEGTP
ncbi:allophanate hydrolase subunit 1 [Arthrobacter sp. MWB30]|nr:allophanate hydrolase subunit 1 [Arthrobacter sp. MWB30]